MKETQKKISVRNNGDKIWPKVKSKQLFKVGVRMYQR